MVWGEELVSCALLPALFRSPYQSMTKIGCYCCSSIYLLGCCLAILIMRRGKVEVIIEHGSWLPGMVAFNKKSCISLTEQHLPFRVTLLCLECVLMSYCPAVCHTVILSHCHTVPLSYCHTVILSHCLTVTLSQSYCHTVKLSYCHTVLLSHFHTVLLSHCHTVALSYCHTVDVILSHCHTVPLSYCPIVLLSYCHTVLLSFCLIHRYIITSFNYTYA